jgi:hypothetical protein
MVIERVEDEYTTVGEDKAYYYRQDGETIARLVHHENPQRDICTMRFCGKWELKPSQDSQLKGKNFKTLAQADRAVARALKVKRIITPRFESSMHNHW